MLQDGRGIDSNKRVMSLYPPATAGGSDLSSSSHACEQRDWKRRQDFRERERAVARRELAPGENVAEARRRESDERERRVGPRFGAQTQRPFAPRAEPREEARGDGDCRVAVALAREGHDRFGSTPGRGQWHVTPAREQFGALAPEVERACRDVHLDATVFGLFEETFDELRHVAVAYVAKRREHRAAQFVINGASVVRVNECEGPKLRALIEVWD